MTYAALCFAFLAGAMTLNALASWLIGVGHWRPCAALAAAAAVAALLMVAL